MVREPTSHCMTNTDMALVHRGAYDNETVPGSKPYEDGLELTVSLCQLGVWLSIPTTSFSISNLPD